MNDVEQTIRKDSPGEIEAESVSLASDQGPRTGQIWVNTITHEILTDGSESANAKLRHYFSDIDAAIEKWGAFGADKKVPAKVRVILRKIEASLGAKVEELFFHEPKSYLAVTTTESNHAAVAWESNGLAFFYTQLPAVSPGRIVIKETPAPAHRTCMTCGSPVPPTRGCEWCPEDNQ
ncbi:MAG: hypothetical protein RJA15_904 [Actinomycetota bacterium]